MLEYREFRLRQIELQIIYSMSDICFQLDNVIRKNSYDAFQHFVYSMRAYTKYEADFDAYDYLVSKNPIPAAFLSTVKKKPVRLISSDDKGGYYDTHRAPIRAGEYEIFGCDGKIYQGCKEIITVQTAGDFAIVRYARLDMELDRLMSKPLIEVYEKGGKIDSGKSFDDISFILERYIKKLEANRVDYSFDGCIIRYSPSRDNALPAEALKKLERLRDSVIATGYMDNPVKAWSRLLSEYGKQEKQK